ncbi:MAG TPA: phosphatidylserine decarboxylase [Candidatus Limnocylindria bacterium]|nr:phosphatidylserine decarboxylase [Candidatus Limnocylindria bacterium]
MKHRGKAAKAAARILGIGVVITGILAVLAWKFVFASVAVAVLALFGLFAAFTLYFFRDPEAKVPAGKALIVSPGHGTVDTIDRVTESEIMGGSCQRISIFLSVFNVHVQQSPVAGKVTYVKHTPGQFMNALKIECAAVNENVLIGFQSAEPAGQTIAVRLITGLIARRIIPWVTVEDVVAKGERISLIQFGSRVDVYLPLHAEVAATLGQKVVGGETVIARIMQ